MLDFGEEHKLAQSAIRSWCAEHLEPKVLAMEAGELSIYPVMREMAQVFGIPDMVRASLARQEAHDEAQKDEPSAKKTSRGVGVDNAMMAVLMMELSRVCPGFTLAFGASLGLFGGAVMARGTREQKARWALPVLTLERIGAW